MSTSAHPNPPIQPNPAAGRAPAVAHARAAAPAAAARPTELRVLLRAVPALDDLDDPILDRLAERCESFAVGDGQAVFREGEECAGAYVVMEGQVRVFRGRAGAEHPLHVAGPGRALGDLPFARGERHAASAVATAPARLLFLSRHVVEGLYRADPEVAHAVIESLAHRLRDLALRAHALTFRDVVPRLAVLLAGAAERRGTPSVEGGVDLVLGRTQEEIAHEIGAARESVSRAWGQLRDQRLIEPRRGHRVHIPDVQRLRDVADG